MLKRSDRRTALGYLGATGVVALAGCSRSDLQDEVEDEEADGAAGAPSAPEVSCLVRPEQTEGPYFLDEMLNRSDIRSDPASGAVKPGVLLGVTFRVYDATDQICIAAPDAVVDLWQCDAGGLYSDIPGNGLDTAGQKFLRGYQRTDASGSVTFSTVYPGWYPGRTPHLHFKIRLVDRRGAQRSFTSQLYFEEAVNDAVLALAPYSDRGPRTVSNAADGIFRAGGSELVLPLAPSGAGYSGTFELGLVLG